MAAHTSVRQQFVDFVASGPPGLAASRTRECVHDDVRQLRANGSAHSVLLLTPLLLDSLFSRRIS